MPNNLVVGAGQRRESKGDQGYAFALFSLGKTMRALAAFAAFHALRSHHLPVLLFLLVATAGAAVSVTVLQKPWTGKALSSNKIMKLLLGGLILASTLTLWTLGLRECGPLRTLVMDGAEMPLYYLFSIYMKKEKADKRRTRGCILIIVAYMLLMFDATNRVPSGQHLLRRTKMGREMDERIIRFRNGTMAKLYNFRDHQLKDVQHKLHLDEGAEGNAEANAEANAGAGNAGVKAPKRRLMEYEMFPENPVPRGATGELPVVRRRRLMEVVADPADGGQAGQAAPAEDAAGKGDEPPPPPPPDAEPAGGDAGNQAGGAAQGDDPGTADQGDDSAAGRDAPPPPRVRAGGGSTRDNVRAGGGSTRDNLRAGGGSGRVQDKDEEADDIDNYEKFEKGDDYDEDMEKWDDDLDDDDYEDVTDEYEDYEDAYEDYYYDDDEEEEMEKELDAPRFKEKEKVARPVTPEEASQYRKPHRVIGVLLVVSSSVITQASRGYTRHVAQEIGGAKRFFSLSLSGAATVLIVPGILSYYLSPVKVHLNAVSLGQFLLVGFLWLVLPYYIRSVVSTKLNARILLQAGVIVPFVIACIASLLFGYGQSTGGVSFVLLVAFVMSAVGFKLVMADMRHGPELPTDTKSSDKD